MRRSAAFAHATYGVLYVAPIAAAVSFNLAYAYWLVSGVAVAAVVSWLWQLGGWHRVTALVANCTTSFANLLLAASLYVQGVGFNAQFFYHLDGETFAIARQAYSVVFFGAWAYWLGLCVVPFVLGWRKANWAERQLPRGCMVLAGIAAIAAYAPLLSFASFVLSADHQPATVREPGTHAVAIEPEALQDPKSLVLIFAESLEATYSRRDIFGDDFTPRLTALAKHGVDFDDMRQVGHTGSTITAMVGAMCALPLRSPMPWQHLNSVLPNVAVPVPDQACLGDVLAAHGYRTVFMGGAPLGFAGKGKFLAAHGFTELYGASNFLPRLEDPDYRSAWGIHDDTLFELALRKLDALADGVSPFALTLLTLDTHHPSGLPSGSCTSRRRGASDMEFSIRCSDRLLSGFIDDVRSRYADVVVALFSDHLAHRNELFGTLRRHGNSRRLRFSVWGPDVEPTRIGRKGTHFDVMPTILDFLGFEGWLSHNFGASLLRTDSPWFALGEKAATTITQDLPDIRLEMSSQVVFKADGPSIEIGGQRILATNEGLALTNAIFAMKFDARGNFVGFRDSESLEDFLREASDGFWVGVSTNDGFNRRFVADEPSKLAFFGGCFGAAGLIAEPLWWRDKLDVSSAMVGCGFEQP
ncbi:MAG: sulfatase-like hydrolase/transferase [Gammaproteobacteria bacterium]|nr:sulfatase-like hydrolase/transferase [Gammaproteobacteria bacterium]